MELTHRRSTRATRSELAAALSDRECAVPRAKPNVGASSGSYKTALTEPAVTTGEEASPSFKEYELAVHTVIRVAEHMAGTVVESDSDDTKHEL